MRTCPVCDTDYPEDHATCPTDGAVLIVSRELAPGSLVRGKYRILRKLGQGGMGVVYLAEHNLLGGQVALKFLAGDLGKDPRFIKRFRMEARAAYQLRHPNIAEVTDLDQGEDGNLFIAMEYVDGPSLRDVLERAPGSLAIPRVLEITRGLASGLAAAHAQGTVHRDIKPENILLATTADGRERPKILDFGIVAMTESVTRTSKTHGLLLTPEYAAPEQWLETPSAEIDGRTDLYALGCVLYEMLTGSTPFHAHNTAGWLRQHLDTPPRPPSELRPEIVAWHGLDALVLRLLAKDRELRHKDAAELLSLLDAVHPVPAEERSHVEERQQSEESRRTVVEEVRRRTVAEEPTLRPEMPLEPSAELPLAPPRPVQQSTAPPEPKQEPIAEKPSAKAEAVESVSQPKGTAKPSFWRRFGRVGIPANVVAALPGVELGKLYFAGRTLLAIYLLVQGVLCLVPRWSPYEGIGSRFFWRFFDYNAVDYYSGVRVFVAIALLVACLGIVVSKRTRVASAIGCAIMLPLVALGVLLASIGHGFPDLWVVAMTFQLAGLSGAALMVAGLERLRKGKVSQLFPLGRTLFAAAFTIFVAGRLAICDFERGMGGYSSSSALNYFHSGFHPAIWMGTWQACLLGPVMALACMVILFRQRARSAALLLAWTTLLYVPLFCLWQIGDLFGRDFLPMLLVWLLSLGLGGGALIVAAALREWPLTGPDGVPMAVRPGRVGRVFRQRWVRWANAFAGLALAVAIVLHGLVPRLFYEACAGGSDARIYGVGWLYQRVALADQDAPYFSRAMVQAGACYWSIADACHEVGDFFQYHTHHGESSNWANHFYSKAAALSMGPYRERCDRGDGGGCYALGLLYSQGRGFAENDAEAVALFRRACDANNTVGCKALADAYRNGEGVDRDLSKAEAFYAKACKGTLARECAQVFDSMGDIFYFGNGVARNFDRAGQLYQKSCAAGYSTGCSDLFNVAYAFDEGKSVAANQGKAAVFYTTACDGGTASACTNLGAAYDNAKGVAQDYAKAAALFTKACDRGNDQGCSNLGNSYHYGRGVEQSNDKAREFLSKGCKMGNQWGCDRLNEMH